MAALVNAFAVLGVNALASDEAISKAFRELVIVAHPDKGGNKEAFQRLRSAYNAIKASGDKAEHLEAMRPFRTGQRVRIINLVKHPDLNGQLGTAEDWDGLRVMVDMGNKAVCSHAGRKVAFKPNNIQAALP